jgi:hypothetical protein
MTQPPSTQPTPRAMDLAVSIGFPDARLSAFVSLAAAIPDRPTKK